MGRWDYISDTSVEKINQNLKNFTPDHHKSTHWEILLELSVLTGETVLDIVYQGRRSSETNLVSNSIVLLPYQGTKRKATLSLMKDVFKKVWGDGEFKSAAASSVLNFCGYTCHEKLLIQAEKEIEKDLQEMKGLDVNIKQLSFKSWHSISEINGTWDNVSFKKWSDTVDSEILESMTIDEWEEIANLLGYEAFWAGRKYQEFRKKGV